MPDIQASEMSAKRRENETADDRPVDWLSDLAPAMPQRDSVVASVWSGSDAGPPAPAAAGSTRDCPPSPEYQAIIEKISQNILEVEKLGDLDELKNRHNCDIKSVDDAHTFARQAVKSIDPNGNVLTPEELEKFRESSRESLGGVSDKLLPENVAYIRLDNFEQAHIPVQLAITLEKHSQADGVILDLRNNEGGTSMNAYLVSSIFLKEGVIHKQVARVESSATNPVFENKMARLTPNNLVISSDQRAERVLPRFEFLNKPVAVLANGDSASATEIVIAALQDHKAATIIGTRSFGKGDGQYLIPNVPPGGMSRITAARGYSPNDKWFGNGSTERIGIPPDIIVENDPDIELESQDDKQLAAARAHIVERLKAQN